MDKIKKFLDCQSIAVAGASRDPSKYGNIVLRRLLRSGYEAMPINPSTAMVEGLVCYPNLSFLPVVPKALSIITPPHITRTIIEEAIQLEIESIWLQPGAEDEHACESARNAGLNVIDDGSCILVALAAR